MNNFQQLSYIKLIKMYNEDDRQYLQMMQENISRMASNSANCKTS